MITHVVEDDGGKILLDWHLGFEDEVSEKENTDKSEFNTLTAGQTKGIWLVKPPIFTPFTGAESGSSCCSSTTTFLNLNTTGIKNLLLRSSPFFI